MLGYAVPYREEAGERALPPETLCTIRGLYPEEAAHEGP